jgi:glycosyltransferase involved in cell wall biosynthesis
MGTANQSGHVGEQVLAPTELHPAEFPTLNMEQGGVRKTTLVWCVDSPGFGGSEISLIRVLSMVQADSSVVIHGETICPELAAFLRKTGLKTKIHATGNAFKHALRGLIAASRLVHEFPNSTFVIWAHHSDSNRWLQLVLALYGRRFIVVERLVPADAKSFAKSRLSIPIKRFVASRVHSIIVNGKSQVEHYQKLFRLKHARVATISGSRDITKIRDRVEKLREDTAGLRKTLGLPARSFIVCVARLAAQKGQSDLLRALSMLPETKTMAPALVLVGEGPDRSSLEHLATELVPGRVIFAGHTDDPLPYLAACDIFVLPSLAEGLPGALIEAMAAGLPCIATDIPGNRELVCDGETGSLVPVGSPEALAHAIRIMLTDRPFADCCAQAAFDLVAREYDEEVEKREWRLLFSQL